MNAADLTAEMDAARSRVTPAHFDRLERLGVDRRALASIAQRQDPFGVATISEVPGGLYQPDADGTLAMVLPIVIAVHAEALGTLCEWHDIVDLITFRTADPARWLWRIGTAWALGEELLTDLGEPVEIVGTPLEWLARGGEAVCVLDWSDASPAWQALRHGPDLIVADPMLRARLDAALRRTIRLPAMKARRAA